MTTSIAVVLLDCAEHFVSFNVMLADVLTATTLLYDKVTSFNSEATYSVPSVMLHERRLMLILGEVSSPSLLFPSHDVKAIHENSKQVI